jgi:hypothetical protein
VTSGLCHRWRRGLLAAGIAAAVLASGGCSTAPSAQGPLSIGDDGSESGIPVDVGTVMTYGYNIARNTGRCDVSLESAALVPDGSVDGATVEGTFVVDLSELDGSAVGVVSEFPPTGWPRSVLKRVRGTTLGPAPRDGAGGHELVFAVRVTKPGNWRFRGVQVTYRAAGERYTATARNALRLCAPATASCEPPGR